MKASGDRGLWQVTKRDGGEGENKLCEKGMWQMTLFLSLWLSIVLTLQTAGGCKGIKAPQSERWVEWGGGGAVSHLISVPALLYVNYEEMCDTKMSYFIYSCFI